MTELVDTHCHIQSAGANNGEHVTRELWAKEPEITGRQLVKRAGERGVTRLICVGCDLTDSRWAVEFAGHNDGCWASVGIHPHEAHEALSHGRTLPEVAALAHLDKVVAIGESGLDYYYDHSPRADQLAVLEFQLELASQADLPLIFHVREAFSDFWPVLQAYPSVRGVLHSFTDNQANLTKAIDRGLYIGVNGIATFTKDSSQLAVYRAIPLQKLLLETDAPFLTPTPYRGSINEPKHIGTIAAFMADLRGETLQQLATATTQNARQLFGI